jgi:hypothetical protein
MQTKATNLAVLYCCLLLSGVLLAAAAEAAENKMPKGLIPVFQLILDEGDGVFTGKPVLDAKALNDLTSPFLDEMVNHGNTSWYQGVDQFLAEYVNEDGEADRSEALYLFMLAAYFENNVYPFCWAAIKSTQADPSNVWLQNSAVVCFLEIGELEVAGRILDYTHNRNATVSFTYENAAVYFAEKGDAARAAQEKLTALNSEPSWAHDAWDGYHFSRRNGLSASAAFDALLPSNYSLLKSDGSYGSGRAIRRVCCSCNEKFYEDLGVCLDECKVSLGCFTSICTPNLQCCWQKTPFDLEATICYPPAGLQVCLEVNNSNNYTIKLGAKLGALFTGYIGASRDFKGNYNVGFSFAGSSGAKAQISVLSTDPKTKTGASKFVFNPGASVAPGVGLGVNLEASNWTKSPICDLNP